MENIRLLDSAESGHRRPVRLADPGWNGPPSRARSAGLNLFVLQLAVNFLWSPIFFTFQAFGIAFFWLLFLWVLVCGMMLLFSGLDPLAGKLQIPYLLWLTFAAYLNFGVWYYNH